MLAKRLKCTVEEVSWQTPTMVCVRFRTNRPFRFHAGQFISIQIPGDLKNSKATKRLYSLVSTPEEVRDTGIAELCIKYVPGGLGSEFLARSSKGDTFTAFAPYGDFYFHPNPLLNAVFIGTGSGLAPLRSMVLSDDFQLNRPPKSLCVLGVRTEPERIFMQDFKKARVETVFTVSQPGPDYSGARGRVTDYLRTLSERWDLSSSQYYLCGNGEMIAEVERWLKSKGVPAKQIRREAFSSHNGTYVPRKVIPLRRHLHIVRPPTETADVDAKKKKA